MNVSLFAALSQQTMLPQLAKPNRLSLSLCPELYVRVYVDFIISQISINWGNTTTACLKIKHRTAERAEESGSVPRINVAETQGGFFRQQIWTAVVANAALSPQPVIASITEPPESSTQRRHPESTFLPEGYTSTIFEQCPTYHSCNSLQDSQNSFFKKVFRTFQMS